MYRQGSGARQSVRMGEMTPRRIKDFVFVHFNAFKSLMDRDMGLREEGWGTGEGRREGPCGCWSWRRKEKKKKKRKRKPELGYRRGTSTEKTDGESSEGDEKMKNKEWHQNIRRDSERSWHQRGMNTPTQPYFKVHFWGLLSFIAVPQRSWILLIITTRYHFKNHFKHPPLPPLLLCASGWIKVSSERTKGADDKNVCQNKVSKNTRTSSARECRGDQAYVSLHILNKLKGYKASKLPVALHVCVCVWALVCLCVCVEIKARPVLTPCASLGKIKPSWGQGQWRGGNKCEQKRGENGNVARLWRAEEDQLIYFMSMLKKKKKVL